MTIRRQLRRILFLVAGIGLLLAHAAAPQARGAGLSTLLDPFSPFFVFPAPQAEVRLTPTWVWLLRGTQNIPGLGLSLDLKQDMSLESDGVFLDWMVKFQVGRWSARLQQNMRDFKGIVDYPGIAGRPAGEARFEYDGLRIGADVDLLQWNGSRVGVTVDQDLYAPIFWTTFVEDDLVARAKRITPEWSTTLGVHAVLVTGPTFRGVSGVLEARARWPIRGCRVTDWEIGGGFTLPELHFGTIGFRTGYRQTSVDFKNREAFNRRLVTTEVQVDMGGWFAEIVYNY